MIRSLPRFSRQWPTAVLAISIAVATLAVQPHSQTPPTQAQQPAAVNLTITGDQPGVAPRIAVPEFIALSSDSATTAAARTMGRVLWDDLNFEREFALLPRDVASTVPAATSMATVPFDRWRELNADGVVMGTVEKTSTGFRVEVRLYNVRTTLSAFGMTYDGGATNTRLYAHRASDDLHLQQRGLQGVAQTKITFNSDRAGERAGGSSESRPTKEIMFSDYDGENAVRLTTYRSITMASVWSPDARSIAFTRYPNNGQANIFVSHIYEGTNGWLTDMKSENMLPAWSPDGTRIAFTSWRDGNAEIYVMNRDGSNVGRLTNNRADDITPAWSPNGTRIAFTSDRTGSEQIWEMGSDGLGQTRLTYETKADRATWSLAPFNEIAFAAQTGPGYDIKVLDVATRTVRQLTFGEGSNESPAFAPNGRHLAFTSTRAGKEQVFTIDRDGKNVRQITRGGGNRMPNWSQTPRN